MSIGNFFRKLWLPNADELIRESKLLGSSVNPEQSAKDVLERVESFALGLASEDRWEAWRWLIREYRETEVQLRTLRKCGRQVRLAQKAKIGGDDLTDFLGCFTTINADARTIGDLSRGITSRIDLWTEVREKVRSARPRVFVTHSFMMLSEASGIEIASLMFGGLILLGALYIWAFYTAAVGETVATYLTIDDLINHGILALRQVAVALIIIEVIFATWRYSLSLISDKYAYSLHWFVLKYPLALGGVSFVFMALVAYLWAGYVGTLKRYEFSLMTPATSQLATVTDGTILRDVLLVGTTSRTATFLQVTEWGVVSSRRDGDNLVNDCSARVVSEGGGEDVYVANSCVAEHRVLLFDRALIVCHAKGEACLDQDKREESTQPPIVIELSDLVERIEELPTSTELDVQLEQVKVTVDDHLNRHLRLIAERFDELDNDWSERFEDSSP